MVQTQIHPAAQWWDWRWGVGAYKKSHNLNIPMYLYRFTVASSGNYLGSWSSMVNLSVPAHSAEQSGCCGHSQLWTGATFMLHKSPHFFVPSSSHTTLDKMTPICLKHYNLLFNYLCAQCSDSASGEQEGTLREVTALWVHPAHGQS